MELSRKADGIVSQAIRNADTVNGVKQIDMVALCVKINTEAGAMAASTVKTKVVALARQSNTKVKIQRNQEALKRFGQKIRKSGTGAIATRKPNESKPIPKGVKQIRRRTGRR